MKFFGLIIIFVGMLLILPSQTSAQEQQKTELNVTPAILDISAKPGQMIEHRISVRNGSEFALPVSIVPQSLLQDDGELIISPQQKAVDASEWIKFKDTASIIFEKDEVKEIPLEITVPKDASPGGHYAQISIRALLLETEATKSASIVIPEVTVTVFITVPGEHNTDISFAEKNIFPWQETTGAKKQINLRLKNNGNIHDLISPIISFKKDGVVISKINLKPRLLLPFTTKNFTYQIEFPSDYGIYDVSVDLKYANNQKLLNHQERLIISRPLDQFFLIGFLAFSIYYYYKNQKNIKYSLKILLKG